jgi:iron complex transport system substrate-binding protein
VAPAGVVAALVVGLSACGDGGGVTADNAGATGIGDAAATTRVVEDATGEVELPVNFERPVPTDGIWAANMLSLGVQPAAVPSDVKLQLSTVSEYLPEGTDLESLPEVGLQYDINLEALAAAEPDLIVASEFEAEDFGDLYRGIAPTYFTPWPSNGEWRPRFLRVAQALGREEEAQAVSDEFDELVASLPESLDEQTVAFVRASDLTDIRADVLETSFAGSVAREADIPVLDLSEQVELETDVDWVNLSEENLNLLAEADILVISDLSFYDPALEPTDTVLADSALWQTLPAVEAGNVALVPGPVYNGGHYQAATALLTAIAETAGDA